MKRALITGITGQDGSYLAELLLGKGYEVHGMLRPPGYDDPLDPYPHGAGPAEVSKMEAAFEQLGGREQTLHLHYADLNDAGQLSRLVAEVQPEELYNLAGMSHVPTSFERPEYTASTNSGGAVRLLTAVREAGLDCRFFQASTSEMFGLSDTARTECSAFGPRSPYGTSKLAAHFYTTNFRERYDMYAVSGLMFNHESPRRGRHFVTRKVTAAIARIRAGLQDHVTLGSLDPVRDWGYAPEYVEGAWLMLQQDVPDDYVLATGTATTVGEFVEAAFTHVGLDWREHVRQDPRFVRPTEVRFLIGDSSKAHRNLGWKAQTHADDLARIMVDADLALLDA
jgi:GDPmannose 4,6-dehydratase